jgi:hypothetical protein
LNALAVTAVRNTVFRRMRHHHRRTTAAAAASVLATPAPRDPTLAAKRVLRTPGCPVERRQSSGSAAARSVRDRPLPRARSQTERTGGRSAVLGASLERVSLTVARRPTESCSTLRAAGVSVSDVIPEAIASALPSVLGPRIGGAASRAASRLSQTVRVTKNGAERGASRRSDRRSHRRPVHPDADRWYERCSNQ